MARNLLHVTTLNLLLVTIICSFDIISVAERLTPTTNTRLLRDQVHQVDFSSEQQPDTPDHHSDAALTSTIHSNSSNMASSVKHDALNASSTNSSDHAAASSTESHPAPTTMMFVGPAIAGVLAIVLIGGVIAFKKRMA